MEALFMKKFSTIALAGAMLFATCNVSAKAKKNSSNASTQKNEKREDKNAHSTVDPGGALLVLLFLLGAVLWLTKTDKKAEKQTSKQNNEDDSENATVTQVT